MKCLKKENVLYVQRATYTTVGNRSRRIIEATEKQKGIVLKRLSALDGNFVYHVSDQYFKSYTLKKHS